MLKSKSAKNDYKQRVDHEKPETSADFLNYCLKSTDKVKEDIVTVGNLNGANTPNTEILILNPAMVRKPTSIGTDGLA